MSVISCKEAVSRSDLRFEPRPCHGTKMMRRQEISSAVDFIEHQTNDLRNPDFSFCGTYHKNTHTNAHAHIPTTASVNH